MEASAMGKTVLRLETEDVLRTLETVDPVELLAEELIKRTIGHQDRTRESTHKLVPWTSATDEIEYILSEGLACAMPAEILRMIHAAALAALATRELLVPGGVTVAILGTRVAAQAQLAVLARHVPDIVHVAVRITDKTDCDMNCVDALEPRLIDQLDLAGIGLSVVTELADSLFGANLVVAASEEALTEGVEHASVRDLVRGTLLVNSSGHDLPPALLDHVDQVYVDDFALLPEHADRYLVARHLANTTAGAGRTGNGIHPPVIAADLGLLLTGARPGREQQDDIVMVDLLSAHAPDVHLVNTIAESALRSGLGVRVTV
jgi:ornithine cyclodeaminase/alanine dehydrogenase-like protein (mu-crystallin family)